MGNDISINNVMMDARDMYPHGFHPVDQDIKADYSTGVSNKYTRTEKPPKYYLLDYGLSRRFAEGEEPEPLDTVGTDTTVPEYTNEFPIDPFFVDVYCVGNMIRQDFLDVSPTVLFG
ncbi:hypothetical protein EST38_g7463 [Candolleomyces aberdarensis]|uniref:Protein kinase domain-containing protein n=1 Tax=Candolleomyces aberdarensis TaxID=2316362 RepID=A0A4Q2DHY1_9AGAR|nr:hypothetical protein EST38_g7463 [Candolleomyces aberdarensis]